MYSVNAFFFCLSKKPAEKAFGFYRFITAHIIKRSVAECAAVPVAAVCKKGFHPGAVRPDSVHRVYVIRNTEIF